VAHLRLVSGEPVTYIFDDDRSRLDLDTAWRFLSEEAYWARWRTREVFEDQVRTAWRVVAGYEQQSGELVAFARAFSDGWAYAYLADVFVVPAHRGRGLGVQLVRAMIDDGPGAHFHWLLHTRDAHDLYAKFGFGPPSGRLMERPRRE
jgi:GNAT superfamily N-acetyltransferase